MGKERDLPIKATIPGINEAKPLRHKIVMALAHACIPRIHGKENLTEAVELIKQGNPILAEGDHLSNADGPFFVMVMKMLYPEIGKDAVAILGQRLKFNRFTRSLTGGITHIDVWPTTIKGESEEIVKKRTEMNARSIEAARLALENKRMVFVYPEGTRSREGRLQEFQNAVANFALLAENTYILPFGVAGTERVLSPNRWRIKHLVPKLSHIIPIPHKVDISFGKPFAVNEAIEESWAGGKKRRAITSKARQEVAALIPPSYGGTMVEMTRGKEYNIKGNEIQG